MLKSCLQLSEKTQLILIKFTFIRMFPMRVEWSYLTVRECQQMQLQVWLSAQVKVTGPHTLLLYSDVFHLPNQNSRQKVQGGTGGTQHARGTAWHWSCRCLGAWLVTPRSHTATGISIISPTLGLGDAVLHRNDSSLMNFCAASLSAGVVHWYSRESSPSHPTG